MQLSSSVSHFEATVSQAGVSNKRSVGFTDCSVSDLGTVLTCLPRPSKVAKLGEFVEDSARGAGCSAVSNGFGTSSSSLSSSPSAAVVGYDCVFQDVVPDSAVVSDCGSAMHSDETCVEPCKFYGLEIFGGKARLTRALIDIVGLDATAVDWIRNQSTPCAPCVNLDLTLKTSQDVIIKAVRTGRVLFTHMAPPCGTASRAREIPLSREAIARGVREPRPLRGPGWEDGLPGLVGEDAERVASANILYKFCCELILNIDAMGLMYSIENPLKSWFWLTSYVKALDVELEKRGRPGLRSSFQNCMLGGSRPKWTLLVHNLSSFKRLEVFTCKGEDAEHQHSPWGHDGRGFATTSEAVYPSQLCDTLARLVRDELVSRNMVLPPRAKAATKKDLALGLVVAEAGRQARGHKGPRLVPEFMGAKVFRLEGMQGLIVGTVTEHEIKCQDSVIPVGAKVLSFTSTFNGERRVDGNCDGDLDEFNQVRGSSVMVALPWDKQRFIERARSLSHPADSLALMKEAYENIVWTLEHSVDFVREFRLSQLKKLQGWIRDFSEAEATIHKNLHEEHKPILRSKKFLAFQRLLKEIGHGDSGVVHRMMTGFQISGRLESSGVFRRIEPKNAEPLEVRNLLKQCKWAQKAAEGGTKSCGDVELDKAVFADTLEEVRLGALIGPFTSEELTEKLGPLWVPAKRFGIKQGVKGKVREIDDFSVFGLNSTVVTDEAISLGGTDEIMALIKAMAEAGQSDGGLKLGKVMGSMHEDWVKGESLDIVGKCVDLRRAYKQLVRAQADKFFSVVAVFDPYQNRTVFFNSVVLPFGSTGSVFGFNRVSFALRCALVRFLRLHVTSFYDDFPVLEFRALSRDTDWLVGQFFECLGWEVSKDKELPFESCFRALGVLFDMRAVQSGGAIIVQNTEDRKVAITALIRQVLDRGYLSQQDAASLAGKLVYSEAQHWGRIGSLVCRPLGCRALSAGLNWGLDREMVEVLEFALDLVNKSPPRFFVPRQDRSCNLVFTDASFNPDTKTGAVGGVLFPKEGGRPLFFSDRFPGELVEMWMSSGSKQIIGQAEMLPVVLAKRVWSTMLRSGRNLFFIDNESARECFVRSASPNVFSRALVLLSVVEDLRLGSLNWYARVPTLANWADGPSREDFSDMAKIGAVRSRLVWPSLEELREPKLDRVRSEFGWVGETASGCRGVAG